MSCDVFFSFLFGIGNLFVSIGVSEFIDCGFKSGVGWVSFSFLLRI